jgi:hypothetical protein
MVEKDRLVIAAGDRVLFFEAIPDRMRTTAIIEGVRRQQVKRTRRQMEAEITAMKAFIDEVRIQANQDVGPTIIPSHAHMLITVKPSSQIYGLPL